MSGARSRQGNVWRDARRIGNFVGVRRPASGLLSCGVTGNVARPNDHRKYEFVSFIPILQRFRVTNSHTDLFARCNVRDSLRKNVWPLLIKKRRGVPGGLGFLIDRAGLFAFLDHAANGAAADLDRHVINSGILRKWKGVYRFDGIGCGVLEDLRDRDARQESADRPADFGVLERAITFH